MLDRFTTIVGVEQIDDLTIRHTKLDIHPIFSLLVWVIVTAVVMFVVTH